MASQLRGVRRRHLKCWSGKKWSIIFWDVMLGGADGYAVLRRFKKVFFMSGYTDEAIVDQGVLNSSVEFIQKPFTPAALSKKVREVLDSNGNARALQPE
jgi:DNA-binding response OmpR family regulator